MTTADAVGISAYAWRVVEAAADQDPDIELDLDGLHRYFAWVYERRLDL